MYAGQCFQYDIMRVGSAQSFMSYAYDNSYSDMRSHSDSRIKRVELHAMLVIRIHMLLCTSTRVPNPRTGQVYGEPLELILIYSLYPHLAIAK